MLWFFSGNERIRLPVAAKIALSTAGAATQIVGSPTPVRAENLNPGLLAMQPANQGMRHDASDPLNRAKDRRTLVQ